MQREVLDFLKMHDVEYKENLLLSTVSPIGIGAEAELVVYPGDNDQFALLLIFLEKSKIKYKITGRMSNLLPPDRKYEKILIRTDRLNLVNIKERGLLAYSGVPLVALSRKLCEVGLSGFEELSGIPGSIGGAVASNAGAFGREVADCLVKLTVFDRFSGDVDDISSEELKFSYRHSSILDKGYVILSAEFLLTEDSPLKIKQRIENYKERRINTQPVGYPSLGSTFKRPSKDVYAARLIDECGLKGKRIGGAEISSKHAGFIINVGGASARDYIDLSDYAMNVVYEKFGLKLEREIEIM